MNARIFNIQKFSLNDGPGIRTVVFLKGCPLRCKWCSNPESQSAESQVLWDSDRCLHCNTCVKVCPNIAISSQDERILIDHSHCNVCRVCVTSCPVCALKIEGEQRTLEDVLGICLQDRDFYDESGGGVTFSGGEMLMQPDFVLALSQALHQNNISVAAETSGFASREVFLRVIHSLDFLLFDLKHWDDAKHREGTGVPLLLILDNLRLAVSLKKELLPRIPVIPGYNDSPKDAEGFCMRLRELGLDRVQLLPFHQFGEKKYSMLGEKYELESCAPLHEHELADYRNIFLKNGIEAFF